MKHLIYTRFVLFDSILVDRTFKRSKLAFTLVITIIIIIFASHFLVAFITAQCNGLSSNYYYFYFFRCILLLWIPSSDSVDWFMQKLHISLSYGILLRIFLIILSRKWSSLCRQIEFSWCYVGCSTLKSA